MRGWLSFICPQPLPTLAFKERESFGGLSSQSNGHGRARVLGVPHADMGWPQREGKRSLVGEAWLGPAIQPGGGRGRLW